MKFLHLSDLHVNQYPLGSPHDLDADIRDVMESDAGDLADQVGGIDGIVITGDISFSGQNTEYAKATVWFERIAKRIGCQSDHIWTIPGNHDIDRSVLAAEPKLRSYHDRLRQCDLNELTRELSQRLLDEQAPSLLAPLGNYISFASNYRCQLNGQQPFWITDVDAEDGHKIVLCGLTSVVISDEGDNDGANRLALGTFQCAIPWKPHDAVVVLCHHPPQWLRDGEEAERYFDARSVLQLYGHKHVQRTGRWQDTVRLQSGALHPDRGPGWQPRYNLLRIEWPVADVVRVTVQPRVWWGELTRFGPERTLGGNETQTWDISLARAPTPGPVAQAGAGHVPAAQDVSADQIDPRERRLFYDLSRLPHLAQFSLGSRLGLLTEIDNKLRSFELSDTLMSRARQQDRLTELWDAVAALGVEGLSETNPFTMEA